MKKLDCCPLPFKGIGRNPLTPYVLDYYKCGDSYIELSYGKRLIYPDKLMFGVSVRPESELSKLFYSKEEALKYIEGGLR